MLSITNTIWIRGDLAEVYECFWNPRLWTEITPHVRRVEMLDQRPNFQRFKMEVNSEGKIYLMETQREGCPWQAIHYRQLQPPPFFTRHTGEWSFSGYSDGVRVTLVHQVDVDIGKACEILGAVDAEDAVGRISVSLQRNGLTTMNAIKAWLENRAAA